MLLLYGAHHEDFKISLAKLLGIKNVAGFLLLPCKSIMEANTPPFDYYCLSDTMDATIPSKISLRGYPEGWFVEFGGGR